MVWVRVALLMCLHAVLPAGEPRMGVGERRAHLSKASSEKATGTTQYPVSPMARKILRGTLHTLLEGAGQSGGRLGGGTDSEPT